MTPHPRDTVETGPPEPRRIALLSDVHGNLPAFEAVIEDVESAGVEETWCLGDLVGYGAQPDECVALASETCAVCLIGNHDLIVIDRLDIADFSRHAAVAATWTQGRIGAAAVASLSRLEPLDPSRAIALSHASPRDP